ncbi:GtrA family protein [Furfurilactobacillus sp. WILCCON 0119]
MNLWNTGVTLVKKYWSIISYMIFGGLTTVVNLVVFWLFTAIIPWNYQIANVMAWFLSVLFAYITNKLWVFSSKTHGFQALMKEMSSFFFFRALTLILDVLIMYVGVTVMHGNEMLVKVIDNVLVIIINYFFSKWYIFKATK